MIIQIIILHCDSGSLKGIYNPRDEVIVQGNIEWSKESEKVLGVH